MKNYLKFSFIIVLFFFLTNSFFPQFKFLVDLKKTGDQIFKDTGSEKKVSDTPKSPAPVQNTQSTPKVQQSAPPVQQQAEKLPAIPKQIPFTKSYRMSCTYQADGKTTHATFGVDGLNFIMNTMNIKLGERMDSPDVRILAIRDGSSSVVKFENIVKALGMTQTITIDFEKGRADQFVLPTNRTYIGVCQKL